MNDWIWPTSSLLSKCISLSFQYSFGEDPATSLLAPLEEELLRTTHTYCGKSHALLTKRLAQSLANIKGNASRGKWRQRSHGRGLDLGQKKDWSLPTQGLSQELIKSLFETPAGVFDFGRTFSPFITHTPAAIQEQSLSNVSCPGCLLTLLAFSPPPKLVLWIIAKRKSYFMKRNLDTKWNTITLGLICLVYVYEKGHFRLGFQIESK